LSQLDSSWQPGAVQKLFEKELDNNHEEMLFIAQLASQQLTALFQEQHSSSASEQCREGAKQWVLGCLQVNPKPVSI